MKGKGWLLWGALAVLWFSTVQLYPLIEPDEARYAEIPREMAASGDWLTPRLDGLKYFEKPPLQYWATAVAYKAFGVGEWTARVWALGMAFLCLPLTFLWTRRLFGTAAGLASAGVLAASPFFLVMGHINLLDAGLAFWLSATLFAFTAAQTAPLGSRAERNAMLAAWAAAALAVLSKGIIVPVLAGGTLLVYSVWQRDWQPWRRLHLLLGLPLFLLMAAPWFIAVSIANPEFARFFFLHEHFARFLTTVHQHGEPWWFFLPFVVLAVLPWLAEVPAALRGAWRPQLSARGFQPLRFLLIYCGVVLVFFSISQSKLAPYILPMVPALAAVMGVRIAERPLAWRRAALLGAGLVAVLAAGLVIYSLRRYDAAPVPLLVWTLAAFMVAALAAFNIRPHYPLGRNVAWLAAGSMLAWQCLLVAHGAPPLQRSARALVDSVRPHIDEHTAIYHVGQYRQSVPVYLERTVTLVGYSGELEFGMQQEPGRNVATLEEFERQWRASRNAVAFINPERWQALSNAGLPGRVIGSDRYSIVVSRQ